MKKSERIVLGLVLGAVPPVAGLLAFWWGSLPFLSGRLIVVCAVLGLMAGFIVDMSYLKKWIAHAYAYDLKIWMGIYGFYSVCIFGFFMGVPAFNVVLAVPAGFFIGSKLAHRQVESVKNTADLSEELVYLPLWCWHWFVWLRQPLLYVIPIQAITCEGYYTLVLK